MSTTSLADKIWTNLKTAEALIPNAYTPSETITVCTFDGSNGEFNGLTTPPPPPPPTKPPYPIDGGEPPPHPSVEPNAVILTLQFVFANCGTGMVMIGSSQYNLKSGANTIEIPYGGASGAVQWYAVWGRGYGPKPNYSHTDTLIINRPPILGVGAFTIPAVPVAIVYEPPCPIYNGKPTAGLTSGQPVPNSAELNQSSTAGTTITTSTKGESSTENAYPSTYATASQWITIVGNVASIVGDVASSGSALATIANTASNVCDLLKEFLSGQSQTVTSSTTQENELALTVEQTDNVDIETSAHTGPGQGDVMIALCGARLMWMCQGGPPTLSLLDYQALCISSVDQLSSNLQQLNTPTTQQPSGYLVAPGATPLDQASLSALTSALLALDPFIAGGPNATLDPNRFAQCPLLSVGGNDIINTGQSLTQTSDATTSYEEESTIATTYTPSEIPFMNGGGPTTTTTLTNTLNNSNMLSNTQETSVTLKLYGDGTGYLLNIYIDTLFGTFASQLPSAPGPWNIVVTGQLPNFPNQMITLQQGKLKVNTFTDAQGNYAFHDAGFKNGPMTIIKNGVSTPLTYTGKILQNPKINQPPPKMNQPSGA